MEELPIHCKGGSFATTQVTATFWQKYGFFFSAGLVILYLVK